MSSSSSPTRLAFELAHAPIASPRNPGMSESSLFGVKRRAEEAARDPNAGFASAMDLLAREEARIEAKASETARAVRKVVSDATSAAPAVPEDAPHVGTPRAEDPPVPLGDEIAAADPDAARFVAAVMAAAAVTAVDSPAEGAPEPSPEPLAPEPAPEPLAAEASPEPLAPEPTPEPLAAEASAAPLTPEPPPEPLAASPTAASPSAPETSAASPSVGPRALSSSSPSRPDAVGVPAAFVAAVALFAALASAFAKSEAPRAVAIRRRFADVRAEWTRRAGVVRVKTQRAIARVARRFADPSEPVAVEGSAESAALEASRAADDAHVTPSKPIDVDAAPEEGTEAWLVRSAVKSNASLDPASPKAEVEEAAAAAAEVADELEPDDTIFEEASKIGRDLIRGLLPTPLMLNGKSKPRWAEGDMSPAPGATLFDGAADVFGDARPAGSPGTPPNDGGEPASATKREEESEWSSEEDSEEEADSESEEERDADEGNASMSHLSGVGPGMRRTRRPPKGRRRSRPG